MFQTQSTPTQEYNNIALPLSKTEITFKQKINLSIEIGGFLITTVHSIEELLKCCHLRNEVFNIEFRGIHTEHFDYDEFDPLCDHLMIVHKASETLVGTYRLNSSLFNDQFYSLTEFEVENLESLPRPILELGRACIKKNYRKGTVIALLWKGIAEYMKVTQSQTLFGCSSIKVTDGRKAALISHYLKTNGSVDNTLIVKPKSNFILDEFQIWAYYFEDNFTESLSQEAESLIPSLLKSYIKIGAKVIFEPAFDRDFNCIDYLTLLNKSQMSQNVERKYGLSANKEESY